MSWDNAYDHLPGADRARAKYKDANYPVLIGELIAKGVGTDERATNVFPFKSWAASQSFKYPDHAGDFLSACGSAAEAFFARAFVERLGVTYNEHGAAVIGSTEVYLQRRVARFYLDVAIKHHDARVAVEIDGLTFHRMSQEQVDADYRRQRCLVLNRFHVIRFTAKDAMADPEGCWAEVDLILNALAGGKS